MLSFPAVRVKGTASSPLWFCAVPVGRTREHTCGFQHLQTDSISKDRVQSLLRAVRPPTEAARSPAHTLAQGSGRSSATHEPGAPAQVAGLQDVLPSHWPSSWLCHLAVTSRTGSLVPTG